MTEPIEAALFPAPEPADTDRSTGPTPNETPREAVAVGREDLSPHPIGDEQIQPASIDLRLGEIAYRVRASFLPGGAGQRARQARAMLSMHRIDLTQGRGARKGLRLHRAAAANMWRCAAAPRRLANPKSSIGRLDVFARVITDHGTEFDRVREGYKGPLYAEISPRCVQHPGCAPARASCSCGFARGSPSFSDTALRRLHERGRAVRMRVSRARPLRRAKRSATALAVHRRCRRRQAERLGRLQGAPPHRFDRRRPGRPLRPARVLGAGAIAHRGLGSPAGSCSTRHDFYILASREAVVVPPDHAAEMLPYDTLCRRVSGALRRVSSIPGFGTAETGGAGSRAVLEVRSHEVPFLIEHGQIVGRLVYERLIARPDKLYGRAIGSSYQSQGLGACRSTSRSSRRADDLTVGEEPRLALPPRGCSLRL